MRRIALLDTRERWTNRGRSADDLIPEESPQVQLALKRLSPKEAYDRVFRMRRAFQVGGSAQNGRELQTDAKDDSARFHISYCHEPSGPSRTR